MPGATQYQFEFYDGENTYYELRPNRAFYFSLFTWWQFNKTYSVKVRWFNGTLWSNWGPACNVNSPSMAVTQLEPTSCGATITSTSQVFRAIVMSNASQYEFYMTNGVNSWSVVRPNRGCYLSLMGSGFPAGIYTVKVRWKTASSSWSSWGPDCNLILSNSLNHETTLEDTKLFEISAFPIPFSLYFNLTVETTGQEKVNVMVYDLHGRLIKQNQVSFQDNGILSLGHNWDAGVYIVHVIQGERIKTIRVVKGL